MSLKAVGQTSQCAICGTDVISLDGVEYNVLACSKHNLGGMLMQPLPIPTACLKMKPIQIFQGIDQP